MRTWRGPLCGLRCQERIVSFDCNRCCKQNPATPILTPPPAAPSCGAMGGDYCSQGGSCPDGYSPLERSVDYNPCCVTQAGTW